MANAAKDGHLACIKYAHMNGYNIYRIFLANMIFVYVFICFISCRCPWSKWVASAASENGQLECLQYILANGCMRDDVCICMAAANTGNLACLKLAVSFGCPVDATTTASAARKGIIDCLVYLYEELSCPWDARTCASECRYFYIFTY